MGRLPFRFSVRFAIDFVNGEAIMVLIVDHRSRLPEGILDWSSVPSCETDLVRATLFDQS